MIPEEAALPQAAPSGGTGDEHHGWQGRIPAALNEDARGVRADEYAAARVVCRAILVFAMTGAKDRQC